MIQNRRTRTLALAAIIWFAYPAGAQDKAPAAQNTLAAQSESRVSAELVKGKLNLQPVSQATK
jgi:hypothetical protein